MSNIVEVRIRDYIPEEANQTIATEFMGALNTAEQQFMDEQQLNLGPIVALLNRNINSPKDYEVAQAMVKAYQTAADLYHAQGSQLYQDDFISQQRVDFRLHALQAAMAISGLPSYSRTDFQTSQIPQL